MVKTTRQQREALKNVYHRAVRAYSAGPMRQGVHFMNYRQFRKTVQPTFGCDDCVMVRFAGMWLGIEKDGYTHS